ncbi:hypothetical protein BCR39DRAFT_82095 [Naematelia encephala]|uniref:Uncharacterized protein n=1 Tax=Naematelia encephala TaxID=71784 RepID=A0A1Y2BAV4_9TREE|nr:hypothetical protein BCR39DRAFT_82095 [Naematelia encephala]
MVLDNTANTSGVGQKPPVGQRVAGEIKELVGKATNNPAKVVEGIAQKTGQDTMATTGTTGIHPTHIGGNNGGVTGHGVGSHPTHLHDNAGVTGGGVGSHATHLNDSAGVTGSGIGSHATHLNDNAGVTGGGVGSHSTHTNDNPAGYGGVGTHTNALGSEYPIDNTNTNTHTHTGPGNTFGTTGYGAGVGTYPGGVGHQQTEGVNSGTGTGKHHDLNPLHHVGNAHHPNHATHNHRDHVDNPGLPQGDHVKVHGNTPGGGEIGQTKVAVVSSDTMDDLIAGIANRNAPPRT